MINDQFVELNGVVYRWSYTPDPADGLNYLWSEGPSHRFPDEQACRELDAAFLERCIPKMVTELSTANEARLLAHIVREMGASEDVVDAVRCRDAEALGIPDTCEEDLEMNPESDEAYSQHSFGSGTTPLDDIVLRDNLLEALRPDYKQRANTRDLCQQHGLGAMWEIATMGSGPFERREFDEFLDRIGFTATPIKKASTKLIVGRLDWDSDDLDILIQQNLGRDLEIVSQEMYLTELLFNEDIFGLPRAVHERFRDSHPALTYIGGKWDGWENRRFKDAGETGKYRGATPKCGYLAYLGYHVGKSGTPTSQRRPLLRKAMSGVVPEVYDEEYRRQWGSPSSRDRCRKLVETIEYLCQAFSKRKDYSTAIKGWKSDLDWLYRQIRQ